MRQAHARVSTSWFAQTPTQDDGYGMLVAKAHMSSGYSFLQPFNSSTWLMVLGALVGVMFMLIVLDAVTRRARLRAFEREHGPVLTKRRRKRGAAAAAAATRAAVADRLHTRGARCCCWLTHAAAAHVLRAQTRRWAMQLRR